MIFIFPLSRRWRLSGSQLPQYFVWITFTGLAACYLDIDWYWLIFGEYFVIGCNFLCLIIHRARIRSRHSLRSYYVKKWCSLLFQISKAFPQFLSFVSIGHISKFQAPLKNNENHPDKIRNETSPLFLKRSYLTDAGTGFVMKILETMKHGQIVLVIKISLLRTEV